jgi:hypothetical protein
MIVSDRAQTVVRMYYRLLLGHKLSSAALIRPVLRLAG